MGVGNHLTLLLHNTHLQPPGVCTRLHVCVSLNEWACVRQTPPDIRFCFFLILFQLWKMSSSFPGRCKYYQLERHFREKLFKSHWGVFVWSDCGQTMLKSALWAPTLLHAHTRRTVFSNWNPVPASQLTQVQRACSLSLHNMEMPLSVLFWHNTRSAGQATVCLTTLRRSRAIRQCRSHGCETQRGLPRALSAMSATGYLGFLCQ